MTTENYDNLIKEAFIDPIRSVLIVDDDYPTLNEILATEDEPERYAGKSWKENPAAVRKVVEEFRSRDAPYILDIHDGTWPSDQDDAEKAGTLQQTDLLVLDYQLEKGKEDGAAALRIARNMLLNEHFNIVLVHTKEELDAVFYKILFGLISPIFAIEADEGKDSVDDELGQFYAECNEKLKEAIGDAQYAAARLMSRREAALALHKGNREWAQVNKILSDCDLHKKYWMRAVCQVLAEFEDENEDLFSKEPLKVLEWNAGETKYIRAERGFVAFKSKDENSLLGAVKRALVEWSPRPSRLMLTKLRAEMNKRGIEVQDDALGETEVGAVWYLRLLEKNRKQRNINATIDQTVRNHSEQLLDQLLGGVRDFAGKILEVDKDCEPHAVVEKRFGLNLKKETKLEKARMGHNAFVGSKPVNSDHLEIGHILKIDDDYWLCVAPACDMVPGQDRGTSPDSMTKVKRFTALKLVEQEKPSRALKGATRGGHVFANISEKPDHASRKAFTAATETEASPTWITMYADDDGYLKGQDGGARLCTVRFVRCEETSGSPELQIVAKDAIICGHLRYEYALEIQSRLVASQSRIGLEFEGSENE